MTPYVPSKTFENIQIFRNFISFCQTSRQNALRSLVFEVKTLTPNTVGLTRTFSLFIADTVCYVDHLFPFRLSSRSNFLSKQRGDSFQISNATQKSSNFQLGFVVTVMLSRAVFWIAKTCTIIVVFWYLWMINCFYSTALVAERLRTFILEIVLNSLTHTLNFIINRLKMRGGRINDFVT
jgi:hypothetical protein